MHLILLKRFCRSSETSIKLRLLGIVMELLIWTLKQIDSVWICFADVTGHEFAKVPSALKRGKVSVSLKRVGLRLVASFVADGVCQLSASIICLGKHWQFLVLSQSFTDKLALLQIHIRDSIILVSSQPPAVLVKLTWCNNCWDMYMYIASLQLNRTQPFSLLTLNSKSKLALYPV
jgi:hypothetical protein